MATKRKKRVHDLAVLHPDAAGIDVGASEIFVAVPEDRDAESVRSFATFTRDLHSLADWLQACGIRSVAMESTSVYWIPLHQILEAREIQVYLVNAQHVKNVPGRKTDVSDCQWIQYLHSVGLLRASFRPPAVICAIRSLWRHRDTLIQMAAEHVMHMQKALDQMNLQVHRVLSDITGLSGLRIMDAILTGERDPVTLAHLCHSRVKSSREIVAKSLEGDYRGEHLFALRQSLAGYRYYQTLITEVDQEIERQLADLKTTAEVDSRPKRTKKTPYQRNRHEPAGFDIRSELYRIFGVDLTDVPGISALTAHTILREVGTMFSSFETHRRSRLGWGYVLSGRSAVARSFILRVVEFVTALPWHFGWQPILYTTLTTILVSSSVVSRASLEKPKPLPLRHTSSLALCFTCSVQSRLMTKASSRDASRASCSVPNSACADMLNV